MNTCAWARAVYEKSELPRIIIIINVVIIYTVYIGKLAGLTNYMETMNLIEKFTNKTSIY